MQDTYFNPDARNRCGFLRSAVAGSLQMPAILHELLAGDAPADPLAPLGLGILGRRWSS